MKTPQDKSDLTSEIGNYSGHTPGKTTAVQRRYGPPSGTDVAVEAPPRAVVQAKGDVSATSQVHEFAGMGLREPATELPFRDQIQSSFGEHDVSHVKAHIGGHAATAASAMGAEAYATGSSVAFKKAPDLHTAAHEAAHVVQQRAGVSLRGGVGQEGDAHERHADAVADAVVRGESAAPLLAQVSGGKGSGRGVQLRKSSKAKSAQIEINGTVHRLVTENAGDAALTVDESVLGPLAKGRLPASIEVSGGALSGDLLATAPINSTLRSGRHIWLRTADGWEKMKGHKERKGEFTGFSKYGGGSVKETLVQLTEQGRLALTPTQITLLNAMSQVETGGQIGCVQTYDNQYVSVGFKQVVLGHGSLEKIMKRAPAGFAKHGLELDSSKTYPKRAGWSKSPSQIVGCQDAQELRQPHWAIKFFHASMEPDVIAAIVDLALLELGKVERATEKRAGGADLFRDPTAQSWLLQTYNNRPAFMAKAVELAVSRGAGATTDRTKFLDILAQAIVDTYVKEEPLLHYHKAKKGKKLDAAQDAALLAKMRATYEPIGKRKGTNVTTKISRNLTVPTLRGGGSADADSAQEPASEQAPAASSPAATQAPAATPAPAATQAAPAATQAAPAATAASPAASTSSSATQSQLDDRDGGTGHAQLDDLPEYACWADPVPVTITASKLRVRSAPDTSSSDNIIGRFERGQRVNVRGREGEWLMVEFQGVDGYIHGGYVEPAEASRPAPSPAPAAERAQTTESAESTAGSGSASSEPSTAERAMLIVEQVFGWLRTLAGSLGEDRDDESSARPERGDAPKPSNAGAKAPAAPTPATETKAPASSAGGGTFTKTFFKDAFTVVDENAMLRTEDRKSVGRKLAPGTRVYVLDARKTYVKIATAPGAAEPVSEADNLWTAFSNLGGTGTDVELGNESSDEGDKAKADEIRGGLPEGRNPGKSPYKWTFAGHFKPSLEGKDLSGSLMAKVQRLMEWAIANDMVTKDIVISDGVRGPQTAHRICVAWEIQHGKRVPFEAVKKLPGGKDEDGNLWYKDGWSWEDVKANAYEVRSSKKIAAAGHEKGDSKRAPLPISGAPGVSRHCTGRAIDVTIPWRAKGVPASSNKTDVWAWEEIYEQFGLHRPLHKTKVSRANLQEPWHIEETGKKLDGHEETED